MSSVRVTRSSRATLRPDSTSGAAGRTSLKRARSPSSELSGDSDRPSKRSCVEQTRSADCQSAAMAVRLVEQELEDENDDDDEADDDDDMPALETIPSSPVVAPVTSGPHMPPPSSTAPYAEAIVRATKALAAVSSPTVPTSAEDAGALMAVDSVDDIPPLEPADDTTVIAAPRPIPLRVDTPAPPPPTQAADRAAGRDDDDDGGLHPDFDGVNFISVNSLERAVAFAEKSDRRNNRFALSKVPSDSAWGSTPQTEKFLCIDDRPITVWLVGVVRSTWFFNLEGLPQPRVNIGITLPHKGDPSALKLLLSRARPRRDDLPAVLYASRFQSRQQKGDVEPTIVPFKNVYDARTRFRAKNEMPLLPPSCIGRNDLVLVEAYFNRWKTAKDKKNRKSWTLWDVGFELQCISLLSEAPLGLEEEEPVPNGDLADDM